ncbi:hypothetical protein Tco_1317822 [Tanacetum coccineum]
MYDVLILSLIQDEDDLFRVIPDLRKRDREEDEDPYAGSNQGKRKRSSGKDSEPSKTSSTFKETFKGNTPPKYSKTSKFASTEETVKEATHEVTMGEEEPVQENMNDANQPQEDATPRKEKLDYMEDCFKALTDRLIWENPEGDRCPFDLSNSLPLKGHPVHLTMASEYFFNNNLEYLKSTDLERKYIPHQLQRRRL